ncbi:PadR family transcriptional regulator [Pseudonocardia alaniniphila]|uniref:PadR family transcriptional regulator n=1 Tax=Pseudonocardia alaniniphila TaxID=75291 RepID=A0ABS9T6W0_9PSEU|nr:PadR family transcriptional regulator [Pseudonocardia alaniniphila]MCH6164259.1 PadR family transcriptional regulator [Pseudonocardia alaniniphila]
MLESHVRAHLDLLLLAVIRDEPGDATAVMRELRERSGGRFTPSSQVVYAALHHLARNRLVQLADTARRRYELTDSGRRSLATKRKAWESFVNGVQGVVRRSAA